MEEIAETVLRFTGGLVRWLLWDLLVQLLLFSIGRFTCLFVTLGHYPTEQDLARDFEKITWIGGLMVFFGWVVIAIYNNVA